MTRTLIISIVALTTACGGAAESSSGASEPRQFQDSAMNRGQRDGEQAVVAVSRDIREACGLDDSQAFFAYDSAQVTARDQSFFRKLADCFVAGKLKGRAMHLVGHADPRGDTDYNYLLGQRRADGVRAAVVAAGLAASQISTTSRGEIEAQGRDEPSWAKDRRVDVLLGDS